ncbi:hypothetical protein WOLCODRAFT_139119 [Wolfiporia cocos MD-104 SS10]|uniref:Ubiquitin 3 binding protein But2 C-terminal domain-containing protein n=1 Tax=Wolfiporia cocos (strain MD-104) TaxID=742152 RepID=A0A2H3K0E7_WOLCO|nr:hypothetical protein WOLCODRAFT_139119 [Wolfiporia cocos MD-104 SS10]
MQAFRRAEYILLATTDSPSSERISIDPEDTKQIQLRSVGSDLHSRLVFWACVSAICSSILSLCVAGYGYLSTPANVLGQSRNIKPLRRPNPYINLDKVLKDSNETFPPIVNFPPIVLQTAASGPRRTMREDHRQQRTKYGTVYPDERHILITSETSTIVQFRNIDYAMERCVLTLSLPPSVSLPDVPIKFSDPSTVDVWFLDTTSEISPYVSSTWEYAPSRLELLSTLEFSRGGPTNSTEFRCPSNEFTTFELVCTIPGCEVDFWQDRTVTPKGGVYLTQHQSVVA